MSLGLLALWVAAIAGLDPVDADIKFDWLSAKAALESNSYDDIRSLAQEFDKTIGVSVPPGASAPVAHPRTPGGILVSLPMLFLDFERLAWVSIAITVACGVWIMWPLTTRIDLGDKLTLLVVAAISAPVFITLRYTGQAGMVAALTLGAWAFSSKRRGVLGGLLLAVAGVLKVFPLLLLLPLLLRRRYLAVTTCVAALVGLNLGGLILPGVGLGDAIAALGNATSRWVNLETNGSLVGVLVELGLGIGTAQMIAAFGLTVALALAFCFRRQAILGDPLPWLAVALLLIPLSWISYDFVLLPAMGALLHSSSRRTQIASLFGWTIWIVPTVLYQLIWVDVGIFSFAARLFLLGVWWLGLLNWVDSGSESTWTSETLAPASV